MPRATQPPSDIDMTAASGESWPDLLRAALAADGRSRYRLARETGISQMSLARFAAGEQDLSLSLAGRLGAALGLRLAQEKNSNKF